MPVRTVLLGFFLGIIAFFSIGCATTDENNVSTIPWNRPQNWEGGGAMGGMRLPGSSGY
jgi:hypothetical protein